MKQDIAWLDYRWFNCTVTLVGSKILLKWVQHTVIEHNRLTEGTNSLCKTTGECILLLQTVNRKQPTGYGRLERTVYISIYITYFLEAQHITYIFIKFYKIT